MKVIETEIEGLEGVETDVGWLVRGGIAAVGNSYTGAEPMEAKHRITSTVSQGSDPLELLWNSARKETVLHYTWPFKTT